MNTFERSTVMAYTRIASEVAKLVSEKQEAYGDSFGKSGEVMAILYPNGIGGAQMEDALVVVRIIDKLFRIATRKDAFGESPWRDINGYSLLALERDERGKHEEVLRQRVGSNTDGCGTRV